ncbi:hypothetical protein [Kribbella sindirgiensis]|uniref:Uncharacterized protein n=1 Tax=Kribbella sindirgiensis TaxID=1124744 RepID=A0A4R0HZU9_9ACTN|nr:hypothetical protein [Kribbella sindirgiensis]TCC15252.1 hypothetical protein E0H50_42310 [Kribbella sindirgiensis]
MGTDEVRKDLRAAVAARQELGPEYEAEIIDSFLEKLDARDRHRSAGLLPEPAPRPRHPSRETDPGGLALAIVSIVAAIPITAIAAGMIGPFGVVICWAGLVAINFARTMARRR